MTLGRVFITGGTGFVGSHVVEEACRQGYEVFVAHRKESNLQYLNTDLVNLLLVDLGDVNGLIKVFLEYNFDYIIHCAGLTRHKNADALYKINTDLTFKLVKALNLAKINVKKFIHISSLAAFGPAENTKEGLVSNQSIARPLSHYGKSKLKGEDAFIDFKYPYLIIRPSAVYGPRDKDLIVFYRLINLGLLVNIGKGDQVLTFIYVKDLANLIVSSLMSKIENKSYFATDGKTYLSSTFQEVIAKSLNKKPFKINLPIALIGHLAHVFDTIGGLIGLYPVLNIEKYQEIKASSWECDYKPTFVDLNFTPKWSLTKGLRETLTWYFKDRKINFDEKP